MSPQLQNMMKRWKVMGELQEEGIIAKSTTEYSNIITERLRRTDNPEELKEMILELETMK